MDNDYVYWKKGDTINQYYIAGAKDQYFKA